MNKKLSLLVSSSVFCLLCGCQSTQSQNTNSNNNSTVVQSQTNHLANNKDSEIESPTESSFYDIDESKPLMKIAEPIEHRSAQNSAQQTPLQKTEPNSEPNPAPKQESSPVQQSEKNESSTQTKNTTANKQNKSAEQKRLEAQFGYTCFTQSQQHRNRAHQIHGQIKTISTDKNQSQSEKVNQIKNLDTELLQIGYPDAFLKQCWYSDDRFASNEIRENGFLWCALGVKIIPSLKDKFSASFVDKFTHLEANSSEFAQAVSQKEQQMCQF